MHPRHQESSRQLEGSYLVSITLDSAPDVAFPGLVTYDRGGSVIANEAIDFTGTPLAGASITEDHGTWAMVDQNEFLVTFVKLASINGKVAFSVTTRAKVQTSGESFTGIYNLEIRDIANNAVIPGGLNGTISGNQIQAEALPQLSAIEGTVRTAQA